MLMKHVAALERAETVESLWNGMLDILRTQGLDQAIYLSVKDDMSDPIELTTIPGLYEDRPLKEDPFLNHSCDSYEIISAGIEYIDHHPYVSDVQRGIVERAAQDGLRSGMGIPMRLQGSRRFGGFLLGNNMKRSEFSERFLPRKEEFRLFCLIVHRRIEELMRPDARGLEEPSGPARHGEWPAALERLTPREREVVLLLASGRSRADTAEICGISVHTVSDYAKIGYRKLGVHNRAQVAALLNQEVLGTLLTEEY